MLERDLRVLKTQLSDHERNATDRRLKRISQRLEQSKHLIGMLWDPRSPRWARGQGLRTRVADLGQLLFELLEDPNWGRDSVTELLTEAREKHEHLVATTHVATQSGAVVDVPGLPKEVAADPALALAIILDMIRVMLWGRTKD